MWNVEKAIKNNGHHASFITNGYLLWHYLQHFGHFTPPFENDTLNALRRDAYRWIPHEVDDIVEIDGYKHRKLGFQHPLEYM